MIEMLFFIVFGAILNRARGSLGAAVWPLALFFAEIFFNLNTQPWLVAAFCVAFWLGETSGWNQPLTAVLMGNQPRRGSWKLWWQFNDYLGESPKLSLLLRGAMWGVWVVAVGIATGNYSVVLFGFAMMPSLLIASLMAKYVVREKHITRKPYEELDPLLVARWQVQEFFTGGLYGLEAYIIKALEIGS